MKRRLKNILGGFVALGFLLGLSTNVFAATYADVVLVVDESSSMGGEHAWLQTMVPSLQAALLTAGVGTGADVNRYG
ncbi:MAG: PEP-CTERM sorting domain-containing protein, partial [Candidatus Omnitrophica bacterium]|nr:PEP-CTERM sorting domain-containing protein [Candidatus Omnitrophota bacterium]